MIIKDVISFEGYYKIDENGLLYNSKNKILTPVINKGYRVITLWKKGKNKQFRYGRLYALHFLENPHNFPILNHKDGNKLNDTILNYEWTTNKGNAEHAWQLGLCVYKESEYRKKQTSLKTRKFSLTLEDEIKKKYGDEKTSHEKLAKIYNCSRATIHRIINNKHKMKAATI